MMRNLQKLGYIALGAVMAFTLTATVPAFAAGSEIAKQLTAYYTSGGKPITLFVNGQKLTPKDANGKLVDPFTVDGTTYLPVRVVAEAFDKKVEWDGAAAAIQIRDYSLADATKRVKLKELIEKDSVTNLKEWGDVSELGGKVMFDAYILAKESVKNGQVGITLGGKYTRIEGDVFTSNKDYGAVLQVCGDERLLSESIVEKGASAVHFEVNTMGVSKLKLSLSGGVWDLGKSSTGSGFGNVYLTKLE